MEKWSSKGESFCMWLKLGCYQFEIECYNFEVFYGFTKVTTKKISIEYTQKEVRREWKHTTRKKINETQRKAMREEGKKT